MDEIKERETPLERSMKRTGTCVVCDCGGYAHVRVRDGFRTCACYHTQHAHLYPDGTCS